MPIQLTTPMNTGDVSSDVCDHVKIVIQKHNSITSTIVLTLQYGTIVEEAWVGSGINPLEESEFPSTEVIRDEDYNTLVTTHTTQDGELTYVASKRGLYEYLQSKYPNLAGNIV